MFFEHLVNELTPGDRCAFNLKQKVFSPELSHSLARGSVLTWHAEFAGFELHAYEWMNT
jgi:hypothetical protein